MRLLLDTQILVWLAGDRQLLSAREKTALEVADELIVSALSLMELRIKARSERRRGKEPSLLSPDDAITFCTDQAISILPVHARDLTAQLDVDPPQGDPFDEMLLAHAQVLDAKLLTRDDKLRDHPLAYHP